MKAVLGLAILLVALGDAFEELDVGGSLTSSQRFIAELKIRRKVKAISARLAKYDPQQTEHQELNILGLHCQADNIRVEGFSNFMVSYIKIHKLKRTFEVILRMPKTSASIGNWKIGGIILSRKGSASVSLENLKIKATGNLNIAGVKDLHVTPSVDNVSVSITGIFKNEQINKYISNMISSSLYDTINKDKIFHEHFNAIITNIFYNML